MLYFNSTLVRLKAKKSEWISRMFQEFQFHIGTIKSMFNKQKVNTNVISIPHWYD